MIEARRATVSEVSHLTDLLRRAYAPFAPVLGPDPPPLSQDLAKDIAEGACLVTGDPPKAFAVFRVAKTIAHLENIAVDPDAQGAGLGRAMLDAVEKAATADGANLIRLATHVDMAATRAFYARAGFSETQVIPPRVILEKAL